MHPMLNTAIQAARKAGKMMLRSMDRLDLLQINTKQRNDFVCNIDTLSEKIIVDELLRAYPDHKILAEEGNYAQNQNSAFCWLIDPLDGTANFIHGIPHFCISIALQHVDKLEVGVVYDPVRDELFAATRGEGAQLNSRRIRVSNKQKLQGALLATGFPFREQYPFPKYIKQFASLFPHTADIRRAGSAALDLAYVAAGRIDAYWEGGLNIWDTAAGILLVKEAGGRVLDFQGGKHYMESGDIVAGTAELIGEMMNYIT